MWVAAQRTLAGAGAVLALLFYALQFKKECGASSPYQCVLTLIGWAQQQGTVAPRQEVASVPEPKGGARAEPPKAVEAPPKSAPPPATPPSPAREAVAKGMSPVATSGKQDRNFTVINSGNAVLLEFYATSCRVRDWGRDLLGNEVIMAGKQYVFNLDDGSNECCFDLRARFEDGARPEKYGVDVCRIGSWSVGNR